LAFSIVYSFALFVQEISKQVIQANLLVFIAKGLLFNSYIWRSQAYVYLDASADPKQSLACYAAAMHASSATFFFQTPSRGQQSGYSNSGVCDQMGIYLTYLDLSRG
jgi:hypothetical protein